MSQKQVKKQNVKSKHDPETSRYFTSSKSFDEFRDYLRHVFLFAGKKSHEIQGKNNFKYFNDRLFLYLTPANIRKVSAKPTLYHLTYDYFFQFYNYLCRYYCGMHFYINVVRQRLSVYMEAEQTQVLNKDYADKHEIVRDLQKDGYLTIGPGRLKSYQLVVSKDLFCQLSAGELQQLYTFLYFMSNITPLGTLGYLTACKLEQYFISGERPELSGKELKKPDYMQFSSHHMQKTIEDDLLWHILKTIKDNRGNSRKTLLRFLYASKAAYSKKSGQTESVLHTVYPIRIHIDQNLGRMYLAAYDCNKKKLSLFRLDRMTQLEECHKNALLPEGTEIPEPAFDNHWVPAIKSGAKLKTIIIIFREYNNTGYVQSRILRTCLDGKLTRLSCKEKKYKFTVKVHDERQLMPWLRQFAPYIVSVNSETLHTQLKEELESWRNSYGLHDS